MIRTIPSKINVKRQNNWPEKALQKFVTIRDVKGKGEKERYTLLNAEFQGIAKGI